MHSFIIPLLLMIFGAISALLFNRLRFQLVNKALDRSGEMKIEKNSGQYDLLVTNTPMAKHVSLLYFLGALVFVVGFGWLTIIIVSSNKVGIFMSIVAYWLACGICDISLSLIKNSGSFKLQSNLTRIEKYIMGLALGPIGLAITTLALIFSIIKQGFYRPQ